MKSATFLALVAFLAFEPASAFAAELDDEEKIRTRRVVRVTAGDDVDIENGDDFVFMSDDGKPFHVRSHSFHRGGYLGVQLIDVTPELRAHFGAPEDAGVMISALSDDGPAAAAGITVGDIVSAVDGKAIANGGELARIIRRGEEGDLVNLEVWRDGKLVTLQATLEERERPQVDLAPMFAWNGDKLEEFEGLARLEGLAELKELGKLEDLAAIKELEEEELRALEEQLVDLPVNVIRINEDHIERALGALNEHLESPEWKERMRSMIAERQEMEERLHELEARLRELEQRLSKLAN